MITGFVSTKFRDAAEQSDPLFAMDSLHPSHSILPDREPFRHPYTMVQAGGFVQGSGEKARDMLLFPK